MEKISFNIQITIPKAIEKGVVFNESMPVGVIGQFTMDFNKDDYDSNPVQCHLAMDDQARIFRDEIVAIEFKKI